MEIGPTASSGGRLRREGCPGCAKTGAMSDYRPVRYAPARPAPAVAAAASQEFLRRMSSRRSVRTFSPDPVPVAPAREREQRGPQVEPVRGEHVLVAPRGVRAPLEDAGVDERRQPVGEHRARDVEVGPQVAEAADAEEAVAQHEQGPALAQHLEGAGERTVLAVVVAAQRHRTTVAHSVQPTNRSC